MNVTMVSLFNKMTNKKTDEHMYIVHTQPFTKTTSTVRSVKNRVNLREVSMVSFNVYNENYAFFRILFFSSIARNIMTSIK